MRFRHHAMLHRGDHELLATAVPFIRAGLRAEGQVVAVVTRSTWTALRLVLGDDGGEVEFHDAAAYYQHPVRTLAAYAALVERHAPRPIWAVTQPPTLRADRQGVSWARYEALVNEAFHTVRAQVICAYDTHATEPAAVVNVRRTHPLLLHGEHASVSTAYTSPARFAAEHERCPLPPDPRAARLAVTGEDLHELRAFLTGHASRHGMNASHVHQLVTAACAIADNAIRHGLPPVQARLWPSAGDLVCEIADHGHWRPGPLVGYIPPRPGEPPSGLWAARMLVDDVEIHGAFPGTRVWLRPSAD
ncbi:anti-sigma factor RsbA family regulatory protein [Actinomadura sp. 6N118]|uniref:anti-sigma factor RsbA family regulatory protein n=1 Tax=Actinomadura sp. 6N118 TaxID=3375151 RepID=UPI003796149C